MVAIMPCTGRRRDRGSWRDSRENWRGWRWRRESKRLPRWGKRSVSQPFVLKKLLIYTNLDLWSMKSMYVPPKLPQSVKIWSTSQISNLQNFTLTLWNICPLHSRVKVCISKCMHCVCVCSWRMRRQEDRKKKRPDWGRRKRKGLQPSPRYENWSGPSDINI